MLEMPGMWNIPEEMQWQQVEPSYVACKWQGHRGRFPKHNNTHIMTLHVPGAGHGATGFNVCFFGFWSCFHPVLLCCSTILPLCHCM
jgi:hypothetical protein